MFIPNYLYINDDRTPVETDIALSEIHTEKSEIVIEQVSTEEIQWEEVGINYTQENGFFKGLLYTLIAGLLFWVFLIWALRELWVNIGGGSLGTG